MTGPNPAIPVDSVSPLPGGMGRALPRKKDGVRLHEFSRDVYPTFDTARSGAACGASSPVGPPEVLGHRLRAATGGWPRHVKPKPAADAEAIA